MKDSSWIGNWKIKSEFILQYKLLSIKKKWNQEHREMNTLHENYWDLLKEWGEVVHLITWNLGPFENAMPPKKHEFKSKQVLRPRTQDPNRTVWESKTNWIFWSCFWEERNWDQSIINLRTCVVWDREASIVRPFPFF